LFDEPRIFMYFYLSKIVQGVQSEST